MGRIDTRQRIQKRKEEKKKRKKERSGGRGNRKRREEKAYIGIVIILGTSSIYDKV